MMSRSCLKKAVDMATPAPIIPTESIGSIPRPAPLIERFAQIDSEDPSLGPLYEDAIRDAIGRFEAVGSPVITDGEQRKYHNFATLRSAWTSQYRPGWSQNSPLRRTRAPVGPPHTRPFPLLALRRLLPGRGHALRARAGQAGGDIACAGFYISLPIQTEAT
jgi:hypothetical protein